MKRTPMKRGKPMRKVSAKRKAHRQSDEGKAGLAYMGKVRAMPCVICAAFGMVQTTRTEAHHCIHGRYCTRKASDFDTIPLCSEHHRESGDPAKVALHQQPSRWKRLYGEDTSFLAVVRERFAHDR